jgi:DNA-binding GntR family transcriptional regulator
MGEYLDAASAVPLFEQLVAAIKEMIASGEIAPGRAIPSKRTATQRWGVSTGTYDRAVRVLKEEGLVRNVRGKGLYLVPPEERGRP